MILRSRLGLCLCLSLSSISQAAILDCDFTGAAPGVHTPWVSTDEIRPNLAFSGWTRGGGAIGDGTIDDAFGFSVSSTDQLSTLAEALAQDESIGFTLTPTGGNVLDLNGVQVRLTIQRHSWHAPRTYAVFSSIDGYASPSDSLFQTTTFGNGDESPRDINFFLPSTGFDIGDRSIEFRIYAFDARYDNHSTSLVDFRLVDGIQSYTLDLSATPGGTVFSNPLAHVIEASSTISVSARPDPGFRFSGWSGDLLGFGNPRWFAMTGNKTIVGNFEPLPPKRMAIGNNVAEVSDYTVEWPFVDLFRRARGWLTRNSDSSGSWDSGLSHLIPVDQDGWPTEVPFDPGNGQPMQIVHTLILEVQIPGTYRFIYEGSGVLQFQVQGGPWRSLPTGGLREHQEVVSSTPSAFWFEIRSTAAPPNHLRNFKVLTPGFGGEDGASLFHPLFIDRLRPFKGIRYMDWGRTNNSPLSDWSNRTTPSTFTQSISGGVSLEFMAYLSNILKADAWICIPHKADDTLVRETARMMRDTLDPNLRVYVEYSNETWNGIFQQTGYVQTQGLANGLSADAWTAGQYFVAQRSARIWRIFEEEFGASAPNRLVKVLATQSANLAVTELRSEGLNDPAINPDFVYPDALAIAPYFAGNVTMNDIPPVAAAYPTVDEILVNHMPSAISSLRSQVREQKAIADIQGWDLICYEGGQHYVGIGAAVNDTTLTAILTGANRDPRIYNHYLTYLDLLKEEGVSVFYNFSNVYPAGRYGSWGILERQDQPLEEAHKYRAILDWIQANLGEGTGGGEWRLY